jgi:hypothetical protein
MVIHQKQTKQQKQLKKLKLISCLIAVLFTSPSHANGVLSLIKPSALIKQVIGGGGDEAEAVSVAGKAFLIQYGLQNKIDYTIKVIDHNLSSHIVDPLRERTDYFLEEQLKIKPTIVYSSAAIIYSSLVKNAISVNFSSKLLLNAKHSVSISNSSIIIGLRASF